jgi:hypothetical protein
VSAGQCQGASPSGAGAMAAGLGGPFSAFQQARAHLPDGRRVSNWYLITPAGGQVRMMRMCLKEAVRRGRWHDSMCALVKLPAHGSFWVVLAGVLMMVS